MKDALFGDWNADELSTAYHLKNCDHAGCLQFIKETYKRGVINVHTQKSSYYKF